MSREFIIHQNNTKTIAFIAMFYVAMKTKIPIINILLIVNIVMFCICREDSIFF